MPATYIGIWDELRKLLAGTPEARARGYDAGRFSFNVGDGRCPTCEGNGVLTVEMSFLPDALLADVIEPFGATADVVGALEVLDTLVVLAITDGLHTCSELAAGVRALVCVHRGRDTEYAA